MTKKRYGNKLININFPEADLQLLDEVEKLKNKYPYIGRSFSAIVREALRCYLYYGPQWRSKIEDS